MLSTPVFSGSLSSSSAPNLTLPTRLRPHDLLRITDQGASDVLEGRFDHLLPAGGNWPTGERWSTRLHADDDLDVWLISWVPDRSTELHDHAGSLGALTVLSGSLVEYRWAGDGLKRRRLDAGDQASFPLGWVHDVMRAPASITGQERSLRSDPTTPHPTLSVHAYSPPLTAMSYYEVTDKSALRRTRTELTDEPEGPSK
ncbi:cysteine dioxygenase family protein [Rhodococcus sp. 14-2470-1a]|uniref:cysteine dioxygenase n=1 Tax=Rhodococcus sp. 14-2470-1a TaxID=2023150 RepID=UPI000B9B38A7|nr:cysteine dioxygenase family protein [Rhodococcus sp. 14-2470-1a]OZF48758.1 cysteine dioxygenase [Rhodococcus sp. 14-2470-1a]